MMVTECRGNDTQDLITLAITQWQFYRFLANYDNTLRQYTRPSLRRNEVGIKINSC